MKDPVSLLSCKNSPAGRPIIDDQELLVGRGIRLCILTRHPQCADWQAVLASYDERGWIDTEALRNVISRIAILHNQLRGCALFHVLRVR